jgi:hypothetical protein
VFLLSRPFVCECHTISTMPRNSAGLVPLRMRPVKMPDLAVGVGYIVPSQPVANSRTS